MTECKIETCANPAACRSLCSAHYQRLLKHGDPEAGAPLRKRGLLECAVEDCRKHPTGQGYCGPHYLRWRRHGDPLAGGHVLYRTAAEAFSARTVREGDCLIWTGGKGSHGYGTIRVNGVDTLAHRYAWETANGEIPPGLFVDHTCYRRDCVEASHLRLATMQQNNQNQPGAHRGRPLPRNVYLDRRSGRYQVQVRHNGQTYYGGMHDNPDDANRAAEALRTEIFGEFAGRGIVRPDLIKQLAKEN